MGEKMLPPKTPVVIVRSSLTELRRLVGWNCVGIGGEGLKAIPARADTWRDVDEA